jgi:hypothetical protein
MKPERKFDIVDTAKALREALVRLLVFFCGGSLSPHRLKVIALDRPGLTRTPHLRY